MLYMRIWKEIKWGIIAHLEDIAHTEISHSYTISSTWLLSLYLFSMQSIFLIPTKLTNCWHFTFVICTTLEHVAQFIHVDIFFPIFYGALVFEDMSFVSQLAIANGSTCEQLHHIIECSVTEEPSSQKKLLEQSISTVASAQTLTSVEHVAESLN